MGSVSKQIILGGFEVLAPTFISNAWRHPLSDANGFAGLDHWQRIARQLDDGGFDFLFFAEHLAYPMNEDGVVPEVVVREAVQFPVHDPLPIIAGLAAVTERLGFVVTSSTSVGHPYLLARSFATVDNLTRGRLGWNIVTSAMQKAFTQLVGAENSVPHERRYDRADEFVRLCLRQWEGGWSDDAMPMDKASGVFTDPSKVHWLEHEEEFFSLSGYFPIAPSPQRTPVLLQAGGSPQGVEFAAKYAECVFIQESTPEKAGELVRRLRDQAEAHGRPRDAIKVVNGLSAILGATAADAARLREELLATASHEAMAALFLGFSGVDLTGFDPSLPMSQVRTSKNHRLVERYQDGRTVGDVLDDLRTSMGGFKVTGTADAVADEIERIVDVSDVDGFLVEHSFAGTASYADFIEQLMPRLRSKGLVPETPRSGTLREMLTGHSGGRLADTHPGAAFRP